MYLHTSLKEHDIGELPTGLFSPTLWKLTTTTTLYNIVSVVIEKENKKMKYPQQQLIKIIMILQHDYDRETLYKTEHNKPTENIYKW